MPEAPAEQRPDPTPLTTDPIRLPHSAVTPSAASAAPRVDETVAAGHPGAARAADVRPADAHVADMWSGTARKYRIRAAILLLANLALYCGLCVFTYWLHFAKPFDFSLASYVEPLRFWGLQTQNLYDFILYPISVDQTPVYGIVIGLLFASIVAVPISVAILYRFRDALPFIAAVLAFAHLPWMGLTLVISCVLASVRPFRMNFRFGSALVGMLPVLAYLYLATRGVAEPLGASISPERKLLLVGPWVLAILAACTMLAAIIFIARAVRYRPTAVAPVMAVMFATPAIIFHAYVGVDELAYRVLETKYGPRSEAFEPVRDATEQIRDFIHRGTAPDADPESQRNALLGLWSASQEEQAAVKHRISSHLMLDLMRHRQAAYEACKDFIADHPDSRLVPYVLYIQARALDTRLDELKFIGTGAQRELYADFPHVQSEPIWTTLLTQYPDSPLAVAARVRVAQLRLRQGDADGALAVLTPPERAAVTRSPASAKPPRRLLRTRPPESTLDFEPEPYLAEAQRLRELIQANENDPRYGVAPLQALAELDSHRLGYREQLLRLALAYPDSLLYDNLMVRWAAAEPDRRVRAQKLLVCTQRFPQGESLPEALFQLADLEVQALGTGDEARRAAGMARMRELVARFGQTYWGRLAAERLKMLQPQSAPATQPAVTP